MNKLKILAVDDDPIFIKDIARELKEYGEVFLCKNETEAALTLEKQKIHIAFIDLNLTKGEDLRGLEVLTLAKKRNIFSILLTNYSGDDPKIIDVAEDLGVDLFLRKFTDLKKVITSAIKRYEALSSTGKFDYKYFFENVYFTNYPSLKKAIMNAGNADEDMGVTLIGPTGTGKTFLSKNLFKIWGSKGQFKELYCSSKTENLIHSELFGHIKGAFTGADSDKNGLLAEANGGVLFIDEIDHMPPSFQDALLKYLEEKTYSPVGSTKVLTSNARIIIASQQPLETIVRAGKFREDLMYRLSKNIKIVIPTLSERKSDIPFILEKINNDPNRPPKLFLKSDSKALIENAPWPGNNRQLINFIEKLKNNAKISKIDIEELKRLLEEERFLHGHIANSEYILDLTEANLEKLKKLGLKAFMSAIEKEVVSEAAKMFKTREEAAKFLKIGVSTFYTK